MGTELTLQRQVMPLAELGLVLAKSGFFHDSKDANRCIVKVLAGQELGIGPVSSMTGIHIIEGKPTLGANLMAATVKRSTRYNYRIKELTDQCCKIEFLERSGDKWETVGCSEFTLADARRAGVVGRVNWKRYPKNMLFARAMSNGAKWYCPDVFGGPTYTPDELGATEVVDATIIPEDTQSVPPQKTETGRDSTAAVPTTLPKIPGFGKVPSVDPNAKYPLAETNSHGLMASVLADSPETKAAEAAEKAPVSADQIRMINELFGQLKTPTAKILGILKNKFGVVSSTNLTSHQAAELISLQMKKAAAANPT